MSTPQLKCSVMPDGTAWAIVPASTNGHRP
jgi:hypothetical protein